MPKLIAGACCDSVDDVIEAQKVGVHHAGLNSNLSSGGLTPSFGALKAAETETGLPIMAVVRPRESAFPCAAVEFRTALLDAETLLVNGVDGIAFSSLNSDDTIDVGRCREMLRLAGKGQTVFYRAIDVVPDWRAAIDLLCELGVTRVLTSGQCAPAFDGAATVAEMIRYAHGRIEIPPGGGTRTHNVQEIVSRTGCTQIHIPPRRVCLDPSALGNPKIHLGLPGSREDRYQILNADELEKMHGLVYAD